MTTPRRAAERDLIALAREMREGRGEGELTARLRDSCEAAWQQVSAEESALLQDLSEDLYLLEERRIVEPLADGETLESVVLRFIHAFQSEDNPIALALVRKVPYVAGPWSLPNLLAIYGRCWDRLGFHLAGAEFLDRAYAIGQNPFHAVQALDALRAAGEDDEVARRAEAAETSGPALLQLQVTPLLYQNATRLSGSEGRDALERLVRMVERAAQETASLPTLVSLGFVNAGRALAHLGRPEQALRAMDRAVAASTADAALDVALVSRGLLKAELGMRDDALQDFGEAVKAGTVLVWPFLYLAYDAALHGRWHELAVHAHGGARRVRSGPFRARLLEWSAIAAANLGAPSDRVKVLLDAALSEDPSDPTIRANLARFHATLTLGAPEIAAAPSAQLAIAEMQALFPAAA